jgi:hypothetical protein
VFEYAPAAGRRVVAFIVVVSKQVTVGALGKGVEAQAALSSESG